MEYTIETTSNPDYSLAIWALEEEVSRLIKDGWQPLGPAQLVFCPIDRTKFSGDDGFTAMQTLTPAA